MIELTSLPFKGLSLEEREGRKGKGGEGKQGRDRKGGPRRDGGKEGDAVCILKGRDVNLIERLI